MSTLLLFLVFLCVGSFLNVWITRLPKQLYADYRAECHAFLDLPYTPEPHQFHWKSRSQCPHCQQQLRWWHNIPLFGFVILKGRCHFCQHPIAWHYPLVEAFCGVGSIILLNALGWHWETLALLVFFWLSLVLSVIDWHTQLLPDELVYIALWLGLLVNIHTQWTSLEQAILGALTGYLSLWGLMQIYYLLTGKRGMGHGDFKLLAAIGAWLGLLALPSVLLVASGVGLIAALFKRLGQSWQEIRHTPMPFGPFLLIGGWLKILEQIFNLNFGLFS